MRLGRPAEDSLVLTQPPEPSSCSGHPQAPGSERQTMSGETEPGSIHPPAAPATQIHCSVCVARAPIAQSPPHSRLPQRLPSPPSAPGHPSLEPRPGFPHGASPSPPSAPGTRPNRPPTPCHPRGRVSGRRGALSPGRRHWAAGPRLHGSAAGTRAEHRGRAGLCDEPEPSMAPPSRAGARPGRARGAPCWGRTAGGGGGRGSGSAVSLSFRRIVGPVILRGVLFAAVCVLSPLLLLVAF